MTLTQRKNIVVLGVTPARGGSKGVPKKNIRTIAGKPLIAWTIAAAKKSKLLTKFVVSTEDAQIRRISRAYGAEVIARPAALATDTADTWSVLKHVLTRTPADVVVILQATSPIRNAGLIDDCVRTFLKADADNLATGFVCKFKAYGSRPQRRQDVKGFFYDDGNIYVVRADLIRRSRRFGKKIIRYETSREENFEIDDEFDFWMAEKILLKRSSRG